VQAHPELKEQLRIIWQSESFGPPPILTPADLPKSTRDKLCEVFLTMSQNAHGRQILDNLGIEHFRKTKVGEDEYDSAREIWKAIVQQ
jgi:ABC-type phosphate/phosphonate transport system substrate-binding protein